MTSYGIRRSDGQWYAGTADKKAVFVGATYDGANVATFSEAHAKRRVRGLRGAEKHGRTFEVLPIGDFHGSR